MRVMTVERNWVWALITAFVFLTAMALTTCARAASHHRHHHHHHHRNHHVAATKRARRVQVSHHSRYHHRRYASTRTRRYHNRSTPRVLAAASRELAALPSGGGTRLVSAMRSQLGRNPTGWSHNWCAHYLDMELRATGHRGGGNLARGYAHYGRPCAPQPGAIAVMPHHVGVVESVGPGYVVLISGNHGHRVGIGRYSRSRIIAYRLPS